MTVAEMVPIEHDTTERVVRTVIRIAPERQRAKTLETSE